MANLIVVLCIFFASLAMCHAKCNQLFGNKVSEAEKAEIVNTHNYLRSLIAQGKVPGQPKGTNLQTMKWDEKLAKEAQKIANTCEFKHVRVIDSRFYVGQNLGWSGSSVSSQKTDWKGVIQRWFDEHKDFQYPNISTGVTGHYTQVVWATSNLIGCGYAYYRQTSWYEKLYVCNYGPGGNYVGQAPYKT